MSEYSEVIVTQVTRYVLSCPDCYHLIVASHDGGRLFGDGVFNYETVDCTNCGIKLAIPVMPTLVVT